MLVKRSIASCIILSLVTCGIYTIFWWINIHNEFAIKNNDNANGAMVVFLSIITCGIYTLIWFYQMGKNVERAGGRNEGVLYLVLTLLGLGLIALALIQSQENELCNEEIL